MTSSIGKRCCKLNWVYFGPQTAKNRTEVLTDPTGGHQARHFHASSLIQKLKFIKAGKACVAKPVLCLLLYSVVRRGGFFLVVLHNSLIVTLIKNSRPVGLLLLLLLFSVDF